MKLTFRCIGILFFILAPCLVFAQEAKVALEDRAHQELRELRDGVLAAINKGDMEGVLAFLHTNCVITWHNAEVSRGHSGVRAYFEQWVTGPKRVVQSFHCEVKVDELTALFPGEMGICFGSSDENFKLKNGKKLNVRGRWSATLVKQNSRWVIANLHASTNLFNNVILDLAKKLGAAAAAVCLGVGLLLGWFIGRRRKRLA